MIKSLAPIFHYILPYKFYDLSVDLEFVLLHEVDAGQLAGGVLGVETAPLVEVVLEHPVPQRVAGVLAAHPLGGEVEHVGDVFGHIAVEDLNPRVQLLDGEEQVRVAVIFPFTNVVFHSVCDWLFPVAGKPGELWRALLRPN